MSKFKTALEIFKSTIRVLGANKKLLLFPVASVLLAMLVALFFTASVALLPSGFGLDTAEHWKFVANLFLERGTDFVDAHLSPPEIGELEERAHSAKSQLFASAFSGGLTRFAYLYCAILYISSIFLTVFCNLAAYSEILEALNEKTVSIRRGFRVALSKWRSVLLWSLFAGLVGILLKQLETRFSFVGQIVLRLIGLTWTVASVFVIPVMIREPGTANPIGLLRKSAGVLKQTWGESLLGFIALRVGLLSFVFCIILCFVGLPFAFREISLFYTLLAATALLIGLFIVYIYVLGVANQVYRCALYIYASEGVIPSEFTPEMMNQAWKVRKSK